MLYFACYTHISKLVLKLITSTGDIDLFCKLLKHILNVNFYTIATKEILFIPDDDQLFYYFIWKKKYSECLLNLPLYFKSTFKFHITHNCAEMKSIETERTVKKRRKKDKWIFRIKFIIHLREI